MILFKMLAENLWKMVFHNFRTFMWIFANFTHCFSMRLWQAGQSEVPHKMGSENARGCTQNRKWIWLWLLEQYHRAGDAFRNHVIKVTGDETWASFVNVEFKEQSKQWMQTHSPKKPNKFEQTSLRKLMAAIFCDGKGVLIYATGDHSNIRSVLQVTKKIV
jgi:hypothetical protein